MRKLLAKALKRRLRKKQLRKHGRGRQSIIERLESRQMLAVVSPPVNPFAAGELPLEVRSGILNNDPFFDLAVLGANGELTVAINGGDDTWATITSNNLGLGSLNGMELGRLDTDVDSDLIVQGPDAISVLRNDGNGQFSVAQTINAPVAGEFARSGGGRIALAIAPLDGDFALDVVTVAPGSDEVLVLLGAGDGTFAPPVAYPSGGSQPVVVAVGNLIGDAAPDIAIGHADGTLMFLEGIGDGTFLPRGDLAISGLGTITDLTTEDFDGDGDIDLAVSGTDQVNLVLHEDDTLSVSPIISGDFSAGLTGWQTEIVGHAPTAIAGTVNALGGFVQLTENASFLTSVSQTFVIPPTPQTITLDILSLGLENSNGGVPDALEFSLLDANNNSLVATHRPEATSFFNANPAGVTTTAAGVTFDGTTVTIDISGIPAGTSATLFVDLIGNPPGQTSVAAIDNVTITPNRLFTDTFTVVPLSGPFSSTAAIEHGDVDGDGLIDLIVTDSGSNELLVFNGDGSGGYVRDPIDLSPLGSGLVGLVVVPLTTDGIDDIAVTMLDSDLVLTPLVGDVTPPSVSFLNPAPGATLTMGFTQLLIQFSEAVQDNGPVGNNSVTNPASYTLFNFGPNGVFEDGAGDDQVVPIDSIVYDSNTFEATIMLGAGALPLVGAGYRFLVEGNDASLAIQDLGGISLGGGIDAVNNFTLNPPPVVTLNSAAANEGDAVSISATLSDPGFADPHTATIDWGDGTASVGIVNEVNGSGSITGTHTYADNGVYTISVTATDSGNNEATGQATATIANVAPSVTIAGPQSADEGQAITLDLATFTDPGFTSSLAGTTETFTATIDWGDGSVLDNGSVSVVQGSVGVLTTGTVSGTHRYANEGTYTATVTVTDDDGGFKTETLTFTVSNVAPSVLAVSDLTGNEGDSLTVTAAFTDAGVVDVHTATLFWGDGTSSAGIVDQASGSVTASHTYADNGSYTIRVEVTDDADATGSLEGVATIANVAPTVTAAANFTVLPDVPLTLNAATFTDPGFTSILAGTTETFTATIDWGDGTGVETATVVVTQGSEGVATTGVVSGIHAYASQGLFAVTVTVADDDGQTGTDTLTVTVEDGVPMVLTASDVTGNEGQAVNFNGTFSDTGDPGPHTATILWGDGSSSPGQVAFANGQGTVAGDHTYADNGQYTITLEVVDSANNTGSLPATATIANVAPTITPASDQTLILGDPLMLNVATFIDPGFTSVLAGTAETFTATIDWGAGAGPEIATVVVTQGSEGVLTTGIIAASHTYLVASTFTATVSVTDDDGGSDTASFNVTVQSDTDLAQFFVAEKGDDEHGDDEHAMNTRKSTEMSTGMKMKMKMGTGITMEMLPLHSAMQRMVRRWAIFRSTRSRHPKGLPRPRPAIVCGW